MFIFNEKENFEIIRASYNNINRNLDYLVEVWKFTNLTKANLTPKQKSLLDLYLYLILSEGTFSETVQAIAFILMVNHHDIYDVKKVDFVEDYEGLNNIDLSCKQQFIKKHGFKFVSDACDKDLRNSIAHLRIMVEEDGSIVEITRKGRIGRKIEDVKKKTDYLGSVCTMTMGVILFLLGKSLEAKK